MDRIERTRLELREALGEVRHWLNTVPAADVAADVSDIDRLLNRDSNVLLKVGMMGMMSSGKTFLLCALQGLASMTIEPRSGRSRPINDLRKTDLPVPDGPRRTLTSPAGISMVTSSQIRWGPKDFVRSST